MDVSREHSAEEAERNSRLIGSILACESERESRLILDSIPGLLAMLTPTGEVAFVNRRVLEYFDRTRCERGRTR